MSKKESDSNYQQPYQPSTSEINDIKYQILLYTIIIGFFLIYYATKNKMSTNYFSNLLIIIGSEPHLIILCIVAIDLVLFSKLSHLSNNSSLIIKNHLIKKYQKKHPQTKTHNDHRTPPIKDPRFDDDNNASESYDEYADRNYDEYDDWGEY